MPQVLSILGFAKSAISTIDYYLEKFPETKIKVSDSKAETEFDQDLIEKYRSKGVEFELGSQSLEFLQGSDFVMISPGIPPRAQIVQDLKKSDLNHGTDLDLFLDAINCPSIAVTGTNGKTTSTSLIAHLCGTEAIGNIGKPFFEFAQSDTNAVMELSSFQLFYSQLKQLPEIAVYLNFSDDHLDWHKDLEEYKAAKAKLFSPSLRGAQTQSVERRSNPETTILNYDDLVCKELSNTVKNNLRLFSIQSKLTEVSEINPVNAYLYNGTFYLAKYLADGIDPDGLGMVTVNAESNYFVEIPLFKVDDLNLVGDHNYANVLAAVLAVDAAGLDIDLISEKVQSFKAVPHRLEYICEINGHKIFNDSKATNPDAAIKAIEAFDKSIAIVGGKNKNLNLDSFVEVLVSRAESVIAIGELKQEIQAALEAKNYSSVLLADNLEQALNLALEQDLKLPIVLAPASSSFDMFSGYEERGDKFRDLALSFDQSVVTTN